ncbi:MAG: hypothetical protein KDH15_04915 [Rhodocyclaceae bacterium]|nr:hypothetical protein [Rhodocyclaceae bacterium]
MTPALPELERIDLPPAGPRGADSLMVLLAGAYDDPRCFVDLDLPAHCRGAGFDAALCLLRTDLAAVAEGRMVGALHQQVIAPARAAGIRRLVLGGISIGAMTALQHQDAYPDSADELLLLAPYPGNREITGTIQASGGVRAWQPATLPDDAGELRSWRALQRIAARQSPVWLGFGSDDRFAEAHRMMASALPPTRVCTLPGGHEWAVWCRLWQCWLAAREAR